MLEVGIKAPGHTMENSIVIVEKKGLYYMIHGDITYTDEALYENKLKHNKIAENNESESKLSDKV